jgi:hypothetical protein
LELRAKHVGQLRQKKIHFRVIGFDQKVGFTILVGGFNPSEKYSSVGMMKFPTEWKNTKCLKPPTRYVFHQQPWWILQAFCSALTNKKLE